MILSFSASGNFSLAFEVSMSARVPSAGVQAGGRVEGAHRGGHGETLGGRRRQTTDRDAMSGV